jgi:DNA-binding winged helix-turn-helix (wHTH) protein/Tol biopolymer transport system component
MGTMPQEIKHLYEFGPFRLDPQRRLLLCANEPVALTPKAIETLIVLVQNRQRVVSKDELMKLLWPNSFVEESNLSQNIFVLRKALGDSTQERRYILTVPGRGYQFTETVREIGREEESLEEDSLVVATHTRSQLTVERVVPAVGHRVWVIGTILLALAVLGGAWWGYHRPQTSYTFKQVRLTANTPDEPIDSTAISPDGKYLGYSDQQGIHLRHIGTGEEQVMPWPRDVKRGEALWSFGSWYPDSTRFLALLAIPGTPASLWTVPILGGEPQKLIEDVDQGTSISPDGASIAFFRVPSFLGSREIWIMGPYGESPHKILSADNQSSFFGLAWSPTAKRVAFSSRRRDGSSSIESCDRDGQNTAKILPKEPDYVGSFAWVSTGRFIFTRYIPGAGDYYSDDLWELPVDGNSGTPKGEPHRLTGWSGFWVKSLSATADGRHLEFLRGTSHESVFVGDVRNGTDRLNDVHRLTMDDYSDIPLAWTADSQQVIFSSMRTGHREIYRQAVDGNTSGQAVTSDPSFTFFLARATPDGGALIVEGGRRGSGELGLYKVEMDGGTPQLLLKTDGNLGFWCANQHANFCVYGLLIPDQKELAVKRLDKSADAGRELLRIPVNVLGDYHWALSPDGSQVAILETRWDGGQVRLFPLDGTKSRTITIKGYVNLLSLDWTPDSKKMLIATSGPGGVTLLRVSLDGNAQPIWHQSHLRETWGIPSPDGRHIAMDGSSRDANAWMIEDF